MAHSRRSCVLKQHSDEQLEMVSSHALSIGAEARHEWSGGIWEKSCNKKEIRKADGAQLPECRLIQAWLNGSVYGSTIHTRFPRGWSSALERMDRSRQTHKWNKQIGGESMARKWDLRFFCADEMQRQAVFCLFVYLLFTPACTS